MMQRHIVIEGWSINALNENIKYYEDRGYDLKPDSVVHAVSGTNNLSSSYHAVMEKTHLTDFDKQEAAST